MPTSSKTNFFEWPGWEGNKHPRCRSCGGETADVFVSYEVGGQLVEEWECILCGKSFRIDSPPPKRPFKKKSFRGQRRY